MKLTEISKLLNIPKEQLIEEGNIDVTNVVEHYFFAKGMFYREKTLDLLIDNKIDFTSSSNILGNLVSMALIIRCPACAEMIDEYDNSYGNGTSRIYNYTCKNNKCKTKFHLSLENTALSITFNKDK